MAGSATSLAMRQRMAASSRALALRLPSPSSPMKSHCWKDCSHEVGTFITLAADRQQTAGGDTTSGLTVRRLRRPRPMTTVSSKPVVIIHTNDQQMVAALVSAHSLKSRSKTPDLFDVRLLRLEETPHLCKRNNKKFIWWVGEPLPFGASAICNLSLLCGGWYRNSWASLAERSSLTLTCSR